MGRLKREYEKLSRTPPPGVSAVSLPSDADLYVWEAFLKGSEGSDYEGPFSVG